MATEAEVITTRKAPTRLWRTVARAVLVVLAFVLLWAGNRALNHMALRASVTYVVPWGGWLWWIALLVLAGVAFGLAAMLPERLHFRPTRAVLLGIVPLLMLVHQAMVIGPSSAVQFTLRHLHFLNRVFFFDTSSHYAITVMLGVAIAAGFAPGD